MSAPAGTIFDAEAEESSKTSAGWFIALWQDLADPRSYDECGHRQHATPSESLVGWATGQPGRIR